MEQDRGMVYHSSVKTTGAAPRSIGRNFHDIA